jgi:GNAT superfamily N-acetyltransferase
MSGADGYGVERLTTIEGSTVHDINALIPQLKPAWKPVSEERLVALVKSESRVYVARIGRRIIGLMIMVPHEHLPGVRYFVEDVVIDADHRGHALARRLLEYAMQDAPASVLSFDLRSHASRTHAHQLYTSLGFRPSDTTVFRLDNPD